ncbi:hypothetical protein M3J09_009027 [Ascochyta lentis]
MLHTNTLTQVYFDRRVGVADVLAEVRNLSGCWVPALLSEPGLGLGLVSVSVLSRCMQCTCRTGIC